MYNVDAMQFLQKNTLSASHVFGTAGWAMLIFTGACFLSNTFFVP